MSLYEVMAAGGAFVVPSARFFREEVLPKVGGHLALRIALQAGMLVQPGAELHTRRRLAAGGVTRAYTAPALANELQLGGLLGMAVGRPLLHAAAPRHAAPG
jgi:hypothetical protein